MTVRCLTLQRIEFNFALRTPLFTLVSRAEDRFCFSALHLRVFLYSYSNLA